MKNLQILVVLLFAYVSCNGQSPILPLKGFSGKGEIGAYYKDIDNDLDTFEGTWLYTTDSTSLKMTLIKKTMSYDGRIYQDLLIGEYQYFENGVELINTLANLNDPNISDFDHEIEGSYFMTNCYYLPVDDCVEGELRLYTSIVDAITPHFASFMLHKRIINGEEAIKANINFQYVSPGVPEETTPDPTLPWQLDDIVFIKQE